MYLSLTGNGLSYTYDVSSTNCCDAFVFDCTIFYCISSCLCCDANPTSLVSSKYCAYVIISRSL